MNNTLIPYLKYVHGLYNTFVILLLIYHGWLGLKIRKERISGKPPTVNIIKKHRKIGPILSFVGIAGFLAGLFLVYLDKGHIFEYPQHFLTGLAIAFSIITTFSISRKIRGRESSWRTLHFIFGIIIVSLYFFQVFLGIGILF